MRPIIKVISLLCLAAVVAGFTYAHLQRQDGEFETVVYHERVKQGDTFNGVIAEYYNSDNEKDCWNEWQTKTLLRNKRLFFYSDGTPRTLKPGDIICIEVRERVK